MNKEKRIKNQTYILTLLALILFIIFFGFLFWTLETMSKTLDPILDASAPELSVESFLEKEGIIPPSSGLKEEKVWYEISAYNSVPEQTDSSPCISADNKNICERYSAGQKLCASNNFKLGSEVYIEGYGKCKIVDRMNKRYNKNIDIFFGKDIEKAKSFGRQKLLVSVIK